MIQRFVAIENVRAERKPWVDANPVTSADV
jgi:hypothetical protein